MDTPRGFYQKMVKREVGDILAYWRGHDHGPDFDEFLARQWGILARRFGKQFADTVLKTVKQATA